MKKTIARLLCFFLFCTSCIYAIAPVFPADTLNKSSSGLIKTGTSTQAKTVTNMNIENMAGDASSVFGEFMGILFVSGWLLNNLSCTFGDYPYAPNAPYISFKVDTGKTYRFTLDTSLGFLDGNGAMAQASFRGFLYKFFGPYFEIEGSTFPSSLRNTDASSSSPVTILDDVSLYGKSKLGGIFSLFQAQGASLAWYLQWLYDFSASSDKKSGIAGGFIFDSYPFKPLGIHMRLDFQELEDGYQTTQFDAQVGFLVKRWEIFCGYQSRFCLSNDSYATDTSGDEISYDDELFSCGAVIGVRLHM